MKSLAASLRVLGLALSMLALPGVARAVPMPLDGTWITLDEFMDEGDYFTGIPDGVPGPWEWNSPVAVVFDITDYLVVTDVFEVYDNGVLRLTTPSLPNWDALGGGPFDAPYTNDPDVAWATPEFSKGSILFAPGNHSITIRDIGIPPLGDGDFARRHGGLPSQPGSRTDGSPPPGQRTDGVGAAPQADTALVRYSGVFRVPGVAAHPSARRGCRRVLRFMSNETGGARP